MKACFCGCGRRVWVGPAIRSANRRGAEIAEVLAEVERRGGRRYPELAAFLAEGERLAATLASVVHGDLDRRAVDSVRLRAWVEQGEAVAPSSRRLQAMIGHAARRSGLSTEAAIAAVQRGMRERGLTEEEAIQAVARRELR